MKRVLYECRFFLTFLTFFCKVKKFKKNDQLNTVRSERERVILTAPPPLELVRKKVSPTDSKGGGVNGILTRSRSDLTVFNWSFFGPFFAFQKVQKNRLQIRLAALRLKWPFSLQGLSDVYR